MKNKLVIIGSGGHGRLAADIAKKIGNYQIITFLDDGYAAENVLFPIISRKILFHEEERSEYDFFVADTNSCTRQQLMENLKVDFTTLIHPSAIIGSNVTIGQGSIIMPGAIINVGAKIGQGVILNTSCSVGYDCQVGDYSHVSTGAHLDGNVELEPHTWVAAGTVVTNDYRQAGIYVGPPATKRR